MRGFMLRFLIQPIRGSVYQTDRVVVDLGHGDTITVSEICISRAYVSVISHYSQG
jgi:hypothetical protein